MFSQYLFIILAISLQRIACSEDNRTKAEKFRMLFQDDSTRERYVNLLKSVITVNEERLNMLKKWYKLQGEGPSFYSGTHLRSPDADESKNLIVFITDSTAPSTTDDKIKNELNSEHLARSSWYYSRFTKKAYKLCKKACYMTVKDVCSRHKCSSRSKSGLKEECKYYCDDKFYD